ncbi:MAG: AarF/ABC1/UbiB kinase family protein [Myxococcales bacterium]|nr:AarF/ABC1/UbiB kinase family protein [Myxococcales bacterium]
MALLLRLARALWLFGTLFLDYWTHHLLTRAAGRARSDERRGLRGRLRDWLRRRRERIDRRQARRLLRGMLRLRGVYIKLGQVLSVMGGFLPRVYKTELEQLQDRVPPQPFDVVSRTLASSLGKPVHRAFARFEPEPIAAASLGQVHEAWLHDGRRVAVKVLYPGIRDVVATDLRVVRLALRVYNRFVPVQNLRAVYDALVDLLRRETDYLHEADCMERMARNFAGQDDVRFPSVVRERTTRDVLTMTFMVGVKITDLEALERLDIDRRALATRLVQCFYEQLFVHRFFHADPHPGNFLVQRGPDGRPILVILDFGAVSEVSEETIEGMVDVLQGFFEQRDELVLRGFHRIGFVAEEGNRALVEQTVLTYFRKLLKVRERTPGALMRARGADLERLVDPEIERAELRELMRSIRYPDGWFYVERASVIAFWLVGQIDPDLDALAVGFPYVLPLLGRRLAMSGSEPGPADAPAAPVATAERAE